MNTINKIRIGLGIGSIVIITGYLAFVMDYNNLSWTNNSSSYTGIIAMVLLLIVNVGSIYFEKRRR